MAPLLPHRTNKATERELVIKAPMRYRYSIVEPNAWFEMVTDAEQVEARLTNPLVKSEEGDKPILGQLCLNDDVITRDEDELERLRISIRKSLYDM